MDKSTFMQHIKYLTSDQHFRYVTDRRNIAAAHLAALQPTGDAALDTMQHDIIQTELSMWEKALRLSYYCKGKLEK